LFSLPSNFGMRIAECGIKNGKPHSEI